MGEPGSWTSALFCRLFGLDVSFQGLHILFEGIDSRTGDATDGAGHLSPESLFDLDIARFLQLVDLNAEVAGRGPRLLPDEDEVGLLDPQQDRHDGQPQFGVQQRIQLFEHCLRFWWLMM